MYWCYPHRVHLWERQTVLQWQQGLRTRVHGGFAVLEIVKTGNDTVNPVRRGSPSPVRICVNGLTSMFLEALHCGNTFWTLIASAWRPSVSSDGMASIWTAFAKWFQSIGSSMCFARRFRLQIILLTSWWACLSPLYRNKEQGQGSECRSANGFWSHLIDKARPSLVRDLLPTRCDLPLQTAVLLQHPERGVYLEGMWVCSFGLGGLVCSNLAHCHRLIIGVWKTMRSLSSSFGRFVHNASGSLRAP